MIQHKPILTDAEMHALICGNPFTPGLSVARLKDFMRQVEKAVVAKQKAEQEQEPVAWAAKASIGSSCFIYGDYVKLFNSKDALLDEYFEATPVPLYAHPMPTDAISSTLEREVLEMVRMLEAKEWADHVGKSELGKRLEWVISTLHNELWEAQTKHSKTELARNQPCGCIVCNCDNDERCVGCGAKNCGTHAVGEIPNPIYIDHIPGAGKMVVPHGYRLVKLADIDTCIQMASIFDDGGDGADPESAKRCVNILKAMITVVPKYTSDSYEL